MDSQGLLLFTRGQMQRQSDMSVTAVENCWNWWKVWKEKNDEVVFKSLQSYQK